MGMQLMTNMRKKNHLPFRDDLSIYDNFFQSSELEKQELSKQLFGSPDYDAFLTFYPPYHPSVKAFKKALEK